MMLYNNFHPVTKRRLFQFQHNSKETIVRAEKVAQLWKFLTSPQKIMLPTQPSIESCVKDN